MLILETERLRLRELDAKTDALFVFELLNTPKFLQFIGDRGVRSKAESQAFIENRYRQSYRDHGFGLYAVELKNDGKQIGMCGFVKRDNLEHPDLGFAFLPEYERSGYGFESAAAMLNYGRDVLDFQRVLAITSLDNEASKLLLKKLGFRFETKITSGDETLNLFSIDLVSQ